MFGIPQQSAKQIHFVTKNAQVCKSGVISLGQDDAEPVRIMLPLDPTGSTIFTAGSSAPCCRGAIRTHAEI
jgi:hypothetical protein